jgi:small subunit ribosomal protein S13
MSKTYKYLISISGISHSTAIDICKQWGLSLYDGISTSQKLIDIESILTAWKKKNQNTITRNKNLYRHISLNTNKGRRLKLGLPVHGQRTRSNAKSARKVNKKLSNLASKLN